LFVLAFSAVADAIAEVPSYHPTYRDGLSNDFAAPGGRPKLVNIVIS